MASAACCFDTAIPRGFSTNNWWAVSWTELEVADVKSNGAEIVQDNIYEITAKTVESRSDGGLQSK